MAYQRHRVALDVDTDVTHECFLHHTRDNHLIGILEFHKPSEQLTWGDIEYFRRRSDEFSVMPFPDCINAVIIDIRQVCATIEHEIPIIPWRLIEEDCPIRLVVPHDRIEHYAGLFEPTWLSSDVESCIAELREFMDMFVH